MEDWANRIILYSIIALIKGKEQLEIDYRGIYSLDYNDLQPTWILAERLFKASNMNTAYFGQIHEFILDFNEKSVMLKLSSRRGASYRLCVCLLRNIPT